MSMSMRLGFADDLGDPRLYRGSAGETRHLRSALAAPAGIRMAACQAPFQKNHHLKRFARW
jgi:hypothetical protein